MVSSYIINHCLVKLLVLQTILLTTKAVDRDVTISDMVTSLADTAVAEPKGRLYVSLDTVSLDYTIPMAEIEETIDFLTLKVATMQYATNLENLKPVTLTSGNLVFTYFQTPLPLHMAKTVCENYQLNPLSITDVNRFFHIPYPLLFHFQVTASNNGLTCLTSNKIVPEQECLDDIQFATQADPTFPKQQFLKDYILKNLTAKAHYIMLNENKFSMVQSPYGNSACLGEMPFTTSASVKNSHEHFFSKLAEIFGHI